MEGRQAVWLEGLKDYAEDGDLTAPDRIVPRLSEVGSIGKLVVRLNLFVMFMKSEISIDNMVKLASFIDPEWDDRGEEEEEKEWWMP